MGSIHKQVFLLEAVCDKFDRLVQIVGRLEGLIDEVRLKAHDSQLLSQGLLAARDRRLFFYGLLLENDRLLVLLWFLLIHGPKQ